ncbi:MAG: hypothetical protein ACI8ZM_000955 [Crocinitomix sp.]|jgi:hypothetical protein
MKNSIYLITGVLLFALASCGGNNYEDDYFDDMYEPSYYVNLDNALDTTVIVSITQEGNDSTMDYEVIQYGTHEIELSAAKYHITATTVTDSVFLDEDFEIDGNSYTYNLNLTKADYILERVTYVVDVNQYTAPTSFTYNGKTYDDIDASVIDGELVVPANWDYNIEDEMPEEVSINSGSNQTTKTKLYRSETFVLYLELFELFESMDLSEEDLGDF